MPIARMPRTCRRLWSRRPGVRGWRLTFNFRVARRSKRIVMRLLLRVSYFVRRPLGTGAAVCERQDIARQLHRCGFRAAKSMRISRRSRATGSCRSTRASCRRQAIRRSTVR